MLLATTTVGIGWPRSKRKEKKNLLIDVGFEPRPFGPEPKSGALDHSAKLSPYENFGNLCNSKLK